MANLKLYFGFAMFFSLVEYILQICEYFCENYEIFLLNTDKMRLVCATHGQREASLKLGRIKINDKIKPF